MRKGIISLKENEG